jgi:hypothetical protein
MFAKLRNEPGHPISIPGNIVPRMIVTPGMQLNQVFKNVASAYVAATRNIVFASGGPAVVVLAPLTEGKPA